MSDGAVRISRTELLRVAQDLNAIIVSLDRIGSSNAEAPRPDLAEALLNFLEDWDVFTKLAYAREVLDSALLEAVESEAERQAVEEQLDRGPYWPSRDPPAAS